MFSSHAVFGETTTQPSGALGSSPYCGLYCLYAASKELGSPIPFEDLLKPEYVTSAQGSSLADIESAAHDHKLSTLSFGNGTLAMLRAAKEPVILHISPVAGAQQYNHFVMLLRCDGDIFSLLDPSGSPLRMVDSTELLASWDRTGVVISRNPVSAIELFASSWLICITWIALVVGGVILCRWTVSRFPSDRVTRPVAANRFVLCQAVIILLITCMFAFGYSCLAATGFLRHPSYVDEVEKSHFGSFLPKIGLSQLDRRIHAGAVLIDARFAKDYNAGHIPGAVSVPIDLDPGARAKTLSGIQRDRGIVIYCQSKGCPFSQRMAITMASDGYTNLALLDGGYEEWLVSKRGVFPDPK
jgi:rhodanese-related sulfurtransferase